MNSTKIKIMLVVLMATMFTMHSIANQMKVTNRFATHLIIQPILLVQKYIGGA